MLYTIRMSDSEGKHELDNQDFALKTNCEHIKRFIQELYLCAMDELSEESKEHIKGTKDFIHKFMKLRVEDDDEDKETQGEISRKKIKTAKNSSALGLLDEKSVLEVLVDKLDNRRTPSISKFDNSSG